MVGCAAERDPINRVQLNALPKSFFVGQKYSDPSDDPSFYARTMVIDVPYGESSSDFLMFTNTVNSTSKIKWEITEKKLVGRVAFERIPGTDGKGPTPETPSNPERDPSKPLAQNNGIVVYEFAIDKQFDIRRDYNSTTGEETNVIVENDTDRRWQDRDYVRVDFSKNLVNTAYDFDTLSLLGVYNGIEYSPLEFDIQNPNDINAPQLDLDNGYFDVTNKVFAQPKTLDLGGGFMLPGCMLPNLIQGGTAPVGNCNPNEITLRHSFRRVVDTDYEPEDWDGFKFEAYGAFTTDRYGYDSNYGLRDSKWHRFISRYNIWERSHYYTNPEKMEGAVSCQTDAECADIGEVQGMSHCDMFKSKCTLPFQDRKAKPVVWHYSDGSDARYFDATRESSEEWDTAMRIAVRTAKYAECKRFKPNTDCGTVIDGNYADEENALFLVKEINACKRGEVPGTDPKDCDALADSLGAQRGYAQAVVDVAKDPQMVVICHSPVTEQDNPVCGKPGTVARLGDLRFNLLTNIQKVETNSPWGIMSDSNDPETGEKVSTSVNVWTYVNDLFARSLVDVLRYIGGELKTADITDGQYIEDWIGAAKQINSAGLMPLMSEDELDKRVAAAAGTTVEKLRAATTQLNTSGASVGTQNARIHQALLGVMKKVASTRASLDAPSQNAPIYQARANLVKGTPMEAAVLTPAMQQLAQSGYGQFALDPATQSQATSIFQGLNPTLRRAFIQKRENNLAARGACIMNFEATAPLGYVALGNILQEKFGKFNPGDSIAAQRERADKMEDYLRRRAQYAVISHEMGHSIGLRHNFVSSSDAWNYRPQYWQLRTNNKAVSKTPCTDQTKDGASCVGPRWQDPMTANESKNILEMWMASSTMEYAGEPTQDILGLGAYDFGAARMFYGDVATVYQDKRFTQKTDAGLAAENHQDEFGGLLGYRFGPSFSNNYHYSQLDGKVGLIEECKNVDPNAFKPANWNEEKDGKWNMVIDGHIVTNEAGQPSKCTQPKVDFVQWDTMKDDKGASKTHAVDQTGRIRVPHGFASDNWADLGNIAVYRHDNGADVYELMHFWIAQQEMYHIFYSYRRGRTDFSVWGGFQRNLSRYHEKMRDAAKAISLYVTLARDTVSQYQANGIGTSPDGFVASVLKQVAVDNTVASSIAFDHFAHVFSRPEPGDHGTLGNNDPVLRSFSGTGFAGTGRAILSVPNGVTGGFGNISLGGRPIENALASDKGRDYNVDYTLNVGSYYEKAFTAMLFTESADNFISASRDDFVDPRFRAVSMADVFPDGFRRWLGNNLTNDDTIKGVYVRGTGSGAGPHPPDLDPNGYALLGETSWWPKDGIETCFPQGEKLSCRDPFSSDPLNTTGVGPVVDPQVGWDQQKFALLFTLLYLPENQRQAWTDQMHIYELGKDSDPGFENRIEFHDPSGRVYVAQTFGTETLYGKTVQKGIGARVLEYANELLQKSVQTTPVTKNGVTWYMPVIGADGAPVYIQDGNVIPSCSEGSDCTRLKNYTSVPALLREAMAWFGYTRIGGLKGVY